MKQPQLRHLKIHRAATKKIRAARSKKNRATITVHFDTDSLTALKTLSSKTGIPYQRLLNMLLTASAAREKTIQSRLNRFEQEFRKNKRHVAA
jgi:predicted DNA binding CopG/RHH family protein